MRWQIAPRGAALLALTLAGAIARGAEAPPTAFLGLRPTEDRALTVTAIAKLSEAQKLRQVAESVAEALSGSTVLGHETLRSVLGRAYLVSLFDCVDVAACLLKVAAPLRARGVTSALVGDYAAEGPSFHVRVRRLDLVRERLAEEVAFDLLRDEASSLGPWRAGLAPLFADTGSLRLVASQPDAQCTLDGRACGLDPDGVIRDVPEGEHLLVLVKEGCKRVERVIAVRRGEQARVALVLEETPVQAQKAPDPAARLPNFEAPGDELKVKPFGSLRVAFLVDDASGGEREDSAAVPSVVGTKEVGLVVLPRPAVLGLTVQAPRQQSGWQTRGALSLGWVKDSGPEIDSAYAELLKEDLGFRVMVGWGQSIVSSLTAGTLTFPEGFGDLAFGSVGLTVSKSLGPILVEGFVGKHKSQFSPQPDPGATSPTPMGALHVALVDKDRMGTLYGDEYPLTIGVSGLLGQERVGIGSEPAWAAAQGIAAPAVEEVGVWVTSLEAYVPAGKSLSFAGEVWIGQDVRLLEGALWQPPRIDPATGSHRALLSAGGWAQVALQATDAIELRLLAGTDEGIGNVSWGRPVGDGDAVRRNRLATVNGSWRFGQVSFGLQLHAVRTTYAASDRPTATMLGAAATSLLKF
jgi:hypothetical protein